MYAILMLVSPFFIFGCQFGTTCKIHWQQPQQLPQQQRIMHGIYGAAHCAYTCAGWRMPTNTDRRP